MAERAHPRAVVEYLRHHLARGPVPFELEYVEGALVVDREEIDERPVISGHLPANEQQGNSEDGGIGLDHGLELRLERDPCGGDLHRCAAVNPPQAQFQRHVVSPRWAPRCAVGAPMSSSDTRSS